LKRYKRFGIADSCRQPPITAFISFQNIKGEGNMLTIREGKQLQPGQKVKVYKNLHKDCFSIMDSKTGLVVAYADRVLLEEVNFKIGSYGLKKAREEKKRNVHAFAVGHFIGQKEKKGEKVFYNPFKYDSFVNSAGEEVKESQFVYLEKGICFVS
jgi:hypothetical protein